MERNFLDDGCPAPLRSEADFASDGERVSEGLRRTGEVLAADELNAAEKFQIVSTVIKSIRPDVTAYVLETHSSILVSQSLPSNEMISVHCTVSGQISVTVNDSNNHETI
jgi:hypothetical protein